MGRKARVCEKWSFAVVGAYRLALIASEHPAVEVASLLALAFDCSAGDTERGVDMALFDCSVRAGVDASTALATSYRHKWYIVFVALGRHYNFA